MSSKPTPGWTMLGMLTWIAVAIALALLAGCAPVVLRNGYEKDDLVLFIKADLFPVLERVGKAYDRTRLPNLAGYSDSSTTRVAGFAPYNHTISVNLYRLSKVDTTNPRHVLILRAVLAHEMGHWVKGHHPEYGPCPKDRVVCEIEANHEGVRILGIGWGIDRTDAIETMWGLVKNAKTTAQGGHDREREVAAFREAFRCTDPSYKHCNPAGA